MVLRRLRPGVTAAQVRAALRNQSIEASVFASPEYGLGGMSPKHRETLNDRSDPGRYVLLSDEPDTRAGVSQVLLGAWRIVQLV